MSNNTYNGWTNYATWRINLECFDESFDPFDYWDDFESIDAHEFAERLKDNVEELLFSDEDDSFITRTKNGYARAFMSEVNWYEIASNMLENIKQDLAQ